MKYLPWTYSKPYLAKTVFFLLFLAFFNVLTAHGYAALPPTNSNNTPPNTPFIKNTNMPLLSDCGAYIDDWVKNLGGTNTEVARSVLQMSDGTYLVAGHTLSDDIDINGNQGGVDFWLVKLDALGNILWERTFGGSSTDTGRCIQETPDGGIVFIGDAFSSDGDVGGTMGNYDFWVLKLDNTGNIQWQQLYGGTQGETPEWIVNTPDGGFAIAGSTNSTDGDVTENKGSTDGWLLKLDDTGAVQWSRTFGGSFEDTANFVQTTDDGGYVVVGKTFSSDGDIPSNNGDFDAFLSKFDNNGNLLWMRVFGGMAMDFAECVRQTNDGGYILTGTTASFNGDFISNHGSNDAFVIKTDALGVTEWMRLYGGGADDGGQTILCNPDGTYNLGAYSFSISEQVTTNNGLGDVWLVQLASDGRILAEDAFGGTMTDEVYDMRFTQNGGVVLCGFTESDDIDIPANNGQGDFWVAQFSPAPVPPPIAELGADVVVCSNTPVTLDATDPNCVGCTYLWEDGPTESVRTVNPVTTMDYTVTITNSVGCTAEDVVIVAVSNLGLSIIDIVEPSGCGAEDGLIESIAFGGTGDYSYTWNVAGETTPNIYNLGAGTFTLTLDDGECTVSETITLTSDTGTPPSVDLGTDQMVCPNGTVELDAQNSGANYIWNNNPSLNTQTFEAGVGTHFVEVEQDGCIGTDTIVISAFEATDLSLGADIELCADQVTLSGNIEAQAYQWSSGETTPSIVVTNTDAYILTITDQNNCTTTDAITVTLFETPIFDFGENQTSCTGVELSSGLTNLSYQWSSGASTPTLFADQTAWYVLTVTNDNNCSYTDSVFVEIVDDLSINLGEDTESCTAVTLDAGTDNLQYRWSTDQTTSSIQVDSTGWYAVTVEDAEGCDATDSIYVTILPSFELDLGADIVACGDTTIGTNLSNLGLEWSTGATTPFIDVENTDTYILEATNAVGCTASDTIEVVILEEIPLELGEDTVSCTPITLAPNIENVSYQWIDLSTNQVLHEEPTLEVANSGSFALYVASADGCTAADSIEVSITSDLEVELGEDLMDCNQVFIETGNTDVTHEWSTGSSESGTLVTTTGNVTVTITDANGCSASDSIHITILEDIALEYTIQNVDCFDIPSGSIALSPSGGTGDYTYDWEHGETTQTVTELPVGTYTVTVADMGACSTTETIEITGPLQPLSADLDADMLTCTTTQVTINTIPVGGIEGYDYFWSNQATTPSISVAEAGVYTVTITDAVNCTDTASIEITQSNALQVVVDTIEDNPCADDALGSISVNVEQGNGDYAYEWTHLSSGNTQTTSEGNLSNLIGGTYQIMVTDAEGCTDMLMATVPTPAPLIPTVQAENGCGDNGLAQAAAIGGSTPYTFYWSNKKTSSEIDHLATGTYSVTITDANNCTVTASTSIENNPFVDFEEDITPIACHDDANGAINITPTNGTTPFRYQWSNGANTDYIDNLEAGNYTIFVHDANDCTSIETFVLANPEPLEVAVTYVDAGITPYLLANPTGGTPPYDIEWSDGTTGTLLENPTNTVYTATITDAYNCTFVKNINLLEVTPTEEAALFEHFSVFPNPNDGNFVIDLQLEQATEIVLVVRNTLGQAVFQTSLESQNIYLPVQLSNAASGVYLVEIRSNKATAYRKVVVR